MDDTRLIKNITIDERLDSYQSFFDHAWAKYLMQSTSGTSLERIVYDLCVAWRGTANTFAFPSITLNMFKAFSEGLANSHEPFGKQWIKVVRENLLLKMGGSLTHTKQKQLHTALESLYDKAEATLVNNPWSADLEELWKDLIDKYEMQVAVFGSQKLTYGALYYAYEDFIVRCMKLQLNKDKYRLKRGKEAEDDFTAAFGDEACKRCWSDTAVSIARETRHALVHNGGRMTGALRCLPHTFDLVEDELQLLAPDTSELHEVLKDRVEYLVTVVLNAKPPEATLSVP